MASFLPELFAWMQRRYPGQVAPAPCAPPPGPWEREEDLRLAVRRELTRRGFDVHDLEQGHRPERGGTRVTKGLADLYFRGQGIRGWIETKRWDNVQTPEQVTWMLGELETGGTYLLVYELGQILGWHERRGATLGCNLARQAG